MVFKNVYRNYKWCFGSCKSWIKCKLLSPIKLFVPNRIVRSINAFFGIEIKNENHFLRKLFEMNKKENNLFTKDLLKCRIIWWKCHKHFIHRQPLTQSSTECHRISFTIYLALIRQKTHCWFSFVSCCYISAALWSSVKVLPSATGEFKSISYRLFIAKS